jgi:hypothetical protein
MTGEIWTWQTAKSYAEANKDAFGGTIEVIGPTPYGDDNTWYKHTYESVFWETIGTRREDFGGAEHTYDHDVNPHLIFTTDPITRGGMYDNYNSSSWEYHTIHPENMGIPWAGDEGHRPYSDDLYNWQNVTVNPPGFTDLTHEFLLTSQVIEYFYGEGRDPEVYARNKALGRGFGLGLGGETTSPLSGLSPLAAIFRTDE